MNNALLLLSGPALALSASAATPLFARDRRVQIWALCSLLALSGVATAVSGMAGLLSPPKTAVLPLGLPRMPMHLRLDALAGFFQVVIGFSVVSAAVYSVGYLRPMAKDRSLTPLGVFLSLFVLGMQGVTLANDAYTFMVFWELMSVTSYFLVVFEHENEANRKAGFLYLLMAHLGGLLILGGFAVLYAAERSFEFDVMRAAELSPLWASMAFLLAGFGFGMKAGVVPLHAWLPEAHPVAPSNASALMSGVMIKVAIFGFLRVVWDLVGLEQGAWWWGGVVLAAGSSSSVSGILLALQQHDLKRLLAYSSVENIGIIVIGLGLAMIFSHFEYQDLAALGIVASLYHTLNHSLFKGLLFMGAGAVLHGAHNRDMEQMGGLIRRMPYTAALFLVGCVSISALPPFNGFVSEWLTFQAALMAPKLTGTILSALIPFSAAMLALAGALAATCFVKVFGVVFQGTPRSRSAAESHEVDRWMLSGMAIPALLCVLLGVFPVWVIRLIDAVPIALIQTSLGGLIAEGGWLWLTPIAPERASYSPLIVMAVSLSAGFAAFFMYRRGRPVRRAPIWSCGHPNLNPRMQYTATSFSQPLRHIFSNIYRPLEKSLRVDHGHILQVKQVRYSVHVQDLAWNYLYAPVRQFTAWATQAVDWLHARRIHGHLALIFATLLILMSLLV
ncbi:MAG: hydrogenase 4 subunit B [Nitrospinae bacterium]|nr:hydrogenase 4 subunit B [Nitrospinota bacterium]